MSAPHLASHKTLDALVINNILLPGASPVYINGTILAGETLPPGSVLGQVTASGKWKLSLSAAADGSQVPRAILMEHIAAFAADGTTPQDKQVGSLLRQGYVNETALKLGTGHTLASIRLGLGDNGIHMRAPGYSG